MALYHFQIGFPKGVLTACRAGIVRPKYLRHALAASQDDRYGKINLPETFNTNKAKVIEVEMKGPRYVCKVVYRVRHCDEYDLIVVMNPDCTVRTVWLNSRKDKHSTLDYSRYAIPS